MFANRAPLNSLNCQNEYMVMLLGEKTAFQAVVSSIVWAFSDFLAKSEGVGESAPATTRFIDRVAECHELSLVTKQYCLLYAIFIITVPNRVGFRYLDQIWTLHKIFPCICVTYIRDLRYPRIPSVICNITGCFCDLFRCGRKQVSELWRAESDPGTFHG